MFFSKKENFEYISVFDIGSDSIVGSFVKRYFEEDRKPLVLYTKTKSFTDIGSAKKHASEPQEILLEIFKKISADVEDFRKKSGFTSPKYVHITLSSPWYASETHCEILKSKEPQEFTTGDFVDMVNRAGDNLRNKVVEKKPTLQGYFASGSHVAENHITGIKINGYDIDTPFGKKYKHIDIDFYLTIIPKNLHDGLVSAVDSLWRNVPLTVSSFALTHYVVAKSNNLLGADVMFVDITGSATEITKIVDGSIVSSKHIYIGKAHFRKMLEEASNIDSYIARSQFELFARQELSNTELANTKFTLSPLEVKWQNECVSYIEKEHVDGFACTEYVLSTDSEFQSYFKNLLEPALSKADFSPDCTASVSSIDTYNGLVVYDEPEMKHAFLAISILYSAHMRLQ